MKDGDLRFDTILQCAGYNSIEHRGHRSEPIYLDVASVQPDSETARKVFAGEIEGFIYGAFSTENGGMVEKRIAMLEGGEAAKCFASGRAAINCTLFSLTSERDTIVVQERIYGGTTQALLRFHAQWKRKIIFVKDINDIEALKKALKGKRPSVIFAETLSNPTLDMLDVEPLAEFAKGSESRFIVDNTFATPVLFRPLEFGATNVIHSTSKFITLGGATLGGISIGSKNDISKIREDAKLFGAAESPFDAWLVLKGISILGLKVKQQSKSALEIARFLTRQRRIKRVLYPGLPNSKNYSLAKKYLLDGYGGVLAFEIDGSKEDTKKFMDSLRYIKNITNLGDTGTNITYAWETTHSKLDEERRRSAGITETLVRLSAGIDDEEDLKEDLDQALRQIEK